MCVALTVSKLRIASFTYVSLALKWNPMGPLFGCRNQRSKGENNWKLKPIQLCILVILRSYAN